MRKTWLPAAAVWGSLLVLAPWAAAQSGAAVLSGTILDPSGAAVVNASVSVSNIDTNFTETTRSNPAGIYVFPNLPPGRYELAAASPGFKTHREQHLTLHVQDTVTIDITLEIGSPSETLSVTAEPLLVNTQDAAVGAVVERQIVENMPLNGRSFQGLITLTAGVNTVAASTNVAGQFVANGQRADTNYFTVDGVSANVAAPVLGGLSANGTGGTPTTTASGGFNSMVSVDALQEFKISTSSFAPEFGRTPGAQVSLSSRSGTNTFHGDVFEYLRNTVLDANDWFLNASAKPRGAVHTNDFGGVLGGPVIHNKLFFFASYEGLRLAAPSPGVHPVPTEAARTLAAATSDNGLVGYMAQFLNAYPLPDGNPATPCTSATTCIANYTAVLPSVSSLDAGSIRVDYNLGQNMTLFGRYSHSPSTATAVTTVSASGLNADNSVYTAAWTDAIGSSMTEDVRFNFTHTTFVLSKNPVAFRGSLNTMFPAGYAQPPSIYSLNQMAIQMGSFLGGVDTFAWAPANADNGNDQINAVDVFTYVHRSHTFKFGVDFRQLNPSYDQANFNWNNQFNGANNCPGGTPAYICGMANLSNIQHNLPQHFRLREFSSFAQDTWKLTARLTITYGLRWEVNPAAVSTNGHPGFAVSPAGFSLSNVSNYTLEPFGASAYPTRWNDIAPRAGLAYQMSPNGKWRRVLRGGYGIFYDTGAQIFAVASNPYNSRTNNLTNGPALVPFPISISNAQFVTPPPVVLTFPLTEQTDNLIDPRFNLPLTQEINVSMEQQLGGAQSLTASYIGNFGRRLIGPAVFPPGKGNPNVLGNGTISDTLYFYGNYSISAYHALQVKLQRQFTHGLGAIASYTWSHSIDDDSSSVYGNLSGGSNIAVPTAEALASGLPTVLLRASSDFDIRHSVGFSLVYEIPAPAQRRLVHALLSHWGIAPIYHYQTALPVDIIANAVSTLGGASNLIQRPQLIPGVAAEISCPYCPGGRTLNTAPVSAAQAASAGCAAPTATTAKGAFCTPLPVGSQAVSGDLGRNALRAFPLGELDMSLHRDFPVRENLRLRFQGDAFNVFNHPSFGPPGINLSTSTFGVATSMANSALGAAASTGAGFSPLFNTGGPRNFQFSLKVFF